MCVCSAQTFNTFLINTRCCACRDKYDHTILMDMWSSDILEISSHKANTATTTTTTPADEEANVVLTGIPLWSSLWTHHAATDEQKESASAPAPLETPIVPEETEKSVSLALLVVCHIDEEFLQTFLIASLFLFHTDLHLHCFLIPAEQCQPSLPPCPHAVQPIASHRGLLARRFSRFVGRSACPSDSLCLWSSGPTCVRGRG
jgi:hypothetical protein